MASVICPGALNYQQLAGNASSPQMPKVTQESSIKTVVHGGSPVKPGPHHVGPWPLWLFQRVIHGRPLFTHADCPTRPLQNDNAIIIDDAVPLTSGQLSLSRLRLVLLWCNITYMAVFVLRCVTVKYSGRNSESYKCSLDTKIGVSTCKKCLDLYQNTQSSKKTHQETVDSIFRNLTTLTR